MSIDASVSLSVGFFMSYENAVKPFVFLKKEKSHGENRYDPKTGRKVSVEKVIDVEGGKYLKLPGSEEEWGPIHFGEETHEGGSPSDDGVEGFFEDLSILLGCEIELFGGELSYIGFTMAGSDDYGCDSYDPHDCISVGPSLYLAKIPAMTERAKLLSKKMQKLGLKPGQPVVYMACEVCY